MMMTGQQYLDSLRDGRRVYLDGDAVPDVVDDPGIGACARIVARGYDRLHDQDPDAINPVFRIPRTTDDLRARCAMLIDHDVTLSLSAVALALLGSAPKLGAADPVYSDRIHRWFDDCARRDVRFAELITDAKGDRRSPPSKQDDPDLY
ncbi:MAG TPA: 4-hydroxyphenylacetate 3-hydroxylase N-terminal domain-containing protein, partial [Ilumatobacter sp.]